MVEARRNEQHVSQTRLYVTRVCELAGVERIPDLTKDAVVIAMGRHRDEGFSTRTVAAYVTAVKAFSLWAWESSRAASYSLKGLVKPSDPGDRRRLRRPLPIDELRILIESTRTAPTWRKVTGIDRTMLYAVAAMSGLRRDEMLSLTTESFRLDDKTPVVVCEGAYTKNHRQAEQPLPESLVAVLRPWLATKEPGVPVFATVPPKRAAMMLKLDLERCGIPYKDKSDRVVDLHSLRHGYVTSLAQAGATLKTVQTLARHADSRTTMGVYAHASLFDTGKAVDSLPDLFQAPQSPQRLAATGTDGRHAHRNTDEAKPVSLDEPGIAGAGDQSINELLAHHLPTGAVSDGLRLASPGITGHEDGTARDNKKPLVSQGFGVSRRELSRTGSRVDDGIRTRDIQIHNLAP